MSNILSLPLEVFEEIVGAISFVDLPHFLQTSKQIKSAFQATRYHRRLMMIPPEVLRDVYELFVNQRNSWSHWSTHNILSSLSNPYCENPKCEDFGQYFLWCSVPALRLCSACLRLPRYKFIRVRDALTTYGLNRGDIVSLPKLKSPKSNFKTGTAVACHNMFISTFKGDKLPDIPTLIFNDHDTNLIFGIKKIIRIFEPKAGGFIQGLICGHCKHDPESVQRNQMSASRWIPRNYLYLHQHIAKYHPSFLESFEQGWNNLTPQLQAKFHDPINNRLPAYFRGLPPQAMRFYRERPYTFGPWTCWTAFACYEVGASHRREDQYRVARIDHESRLLGSSHEWGGLCNVLAEKMDHESSVFGLPSLSVKVEKLPEWTRRQTQLKTSIASEVISGCLQRVKVEALLKIERKLEEEGLEGFKLILNGESIIDELAKVDVMCHSPGE